MKAKDVLRILSITRPTLCKYIKEGYIKGTLLVNGQYDYDEGSVFNFLNKNSPRKIVSYTRVSTSAQKKDLDNQKDNITQFTNSIGVILNEVYSDVGSGMNYDRKSFNKLLDEVIQYKIDTVYITYKDRFGRTSFNMIEKMFNSYGTKIIPIYSESKTDEQDLLEDIISIIHTFSMKMYSKRRKKKMELLQSDLELEKEVCI